MVFDVEARLRLRRAFGVVAPAGLLALAAWFYVGYGSPVTPGERQAPPSDAVPALVPRTDLPAGPGATEPGIYLQATPTVDGAFDVSEVVWLQAPARGVTIRPPDITEAGQTFAGTTVAARTVRLMADGQPVSLGDAEVTTDRSVSFDRPVQQYELSYQLTGATVRSVPSTTGRALGALRPLTESDGLPVVVSAEGASVRNIQCPLLPEESQGCAVGETAGLRTAPGLRSPTALVVVQLDLPRK